MSRNMKRKLDRDQMENSDEEDTINEERSDNEEAMEPMEQCDVVNKVYLPGNRIPKGDKLVCNKSAYVMYHELQTVAPCLSFDIVPDDLGDNRSDFPATLYLISGTQAARSHTNSMIAMKLWNMHKVTPKEAEEPKDEESDDESEEEDDTQKPHIGLALMNHDGCVNRIRMTVVERKPLAATWSENKVVSIWNLQDPLTAVETSQQSQRFNTDQEKIKPIFTFSGHMQEGFAVDWSRTMPGHLATGDCNKNIHLWKPVEGSGWVVDQRPCVGHEDSVEDIQWSPGEANVFASCSVDKSLRIWDARASPAKACMLTVADAHSSDVNVISWNRSDPFLVSGGDDGEIKIWDLRQFQHGKSAAVFKHHTAPITSVEWHPTDSTVFAASGEDDQLTIWDFSVEKDVDVDQEDEELSDIPPQLLFIHQGQDEIKELHWHPQIPGLMVSTANSGFNVFKTISV